MKRRNRIIAVVTFAAAAVLGWVLVALRDDRTKGRFPELRPALNAPQGYTLDFRDGLDFYTWVLAEREKVGERHRSGVGIYFGHHPNLSATKGATEQIVGRICSRPVKWLVERSEDAADPWVRRDVVLEYNYGPGFSTITLHVWVWGPSEEHVAGLAKLLEALSFVPRKG